MSLSVETQEVIIEQPSSNLEIIVPYVLGAKTLTVWDHFKGQMGDTLKYERVDISEAEFNQWTTDDQYMIDLVLSKLGVSRKSEPQPQPEPQPEPVEEEKREEENYEEENVV
jgi:hypothetical protein